MSLEPGPLSAIRRILTKTLSRVRFSLQALLTQLNVSFTTAALELRKTFAKQEWADSPFVYHMPKMSISVRLVLSHSDGKVKGFFRKESTEVQQEVSSTVAIDVVAVPRLPPREGGP